MTWVEAIENAFNDLNGQGSELEILDVIKTNQYLSFENSKTPQRSLNLYLNRDFKGLAFRKENKWILIDEEVNALKNAENFDKIVSSFKANTIRGILALEEKAKNATPTVSTKIYSYIERGAIASKVKELTNYKCQLCEALNQNPISFIKKDGTYYIETHHVEMVSKKSKGVLSINNLVTVCANHHRQLHYGNALIINSDDNFFTFEIDKKLVHIKKISITE